MLNVTVVFAVSGAVFVCENEPKSAILIKPPSVSAVSPAARAEGDDDVTCETSSEGSLKERDAVSSSTRKAAQAESRSASAERIICIVPP